MTLFGSLRMVVSVMALALLSMGQSIASSPLYLQSWTFSPNGANNPTGLQLIAAGGVPPYNYNVTSPAGYNETNTTGIFSLPTKSLVYQYTITDSATPIPNKIVGPSVDSINIAISSNNFGTGSEITSIITPACAGASTGSNQTTAMGLGGTSNNIAASTSENTSISGPAPLTLTQTGVTSGTGYEIEVFNFQSDDFVYLYFDFPNSLAPIVVTATACTGSDIMVTATGGTAAYTTAVAMGTGGGPFTANFSGTSPTTTITGVPVGTYTVTVTDNNTFPGGPPPCSGSVMVTVPSLTFSTSATATSCVLYDGTITVSVTEGSGSYSAVATSAGSTYTFPAFVSGSSTLIRLQAGTYTVVVTDTTSGCTATQTVTVAQGCTQVPICFPGCVR